MTIAQGTACLDPDSALRPLGCCGTAAGGPQTILDVCPAELELVLEPGGLAALQRELDA